MKFREIRLSKDLTQEEVSKQIGITRFTYCNYENGKTQAPYDVLIKLSKLFETTIDSLLDNNTKGLTIYSEQQKSTITDLCELNDDYLELASKYIKNLLADQVELENRRKNLID